MAGFDGYLQKQEQQLDRTIYTEQKQKGLPAQETVRFSDQELIDKYETRLVEESSFEERTRYYFEDIDMMTAKAERYKAISKDKDATRTYGQTYTNRSAKKRRDAAASAASSFESALKLQKKTPADAKGLTLYKHREKIMRLRMEGMVNAAKVKAQSAEDETYRTLKAKLSCLSILKDQLDHLELEATEAEASKFEKERVKLETELEKVKNDLHNKLPSAQSKWEQANNIKSDDIEAKLDKLEEEYPSNVQDLSLGYCVKRDAQGQPLNKLEEKKAKWNEKLNKALQSGDEETVNQMRVERYKRLENLTLPKPEELKKKGIVYFFNQDSAGFFELIKLVENYQHSKYDKQVRSLLDDRPDLHTKLFMAETLVKMFKDREDDWSQRNSLHIYNTNFADVGALDEEVEQRFKDTRIKDQQTKDRTREENKRKKTAKETSADTVSGQMKDGKVIVPLDSKEVQDYASKMNDLINFLGNKMPALDFDNDAVDASAMIATVLYNNVLSSISTCLSKTEKDGITEDVRNQLNKTKSICEEESKVFRQKVTEYRQMLAKYGGSGEEHTWYDALKYGRAVIYNLNQDKKVKTKKLGGGASVVYKFTEKNDGKETSVYFRKGEKLASGNDIEMVQNFFEGLDAKQEVKENILKPVFDALKEDSMGKVGNKRFAQYFMDLRFLEPEKLIETLVGSKSKTKDILANMSDEDKKIASEHILDFCKHVTQREVAHDAGIDYGRNLSDRNVATSRLASLFGIQNNICQSKTAVVVDQDKIATGNVMEETGGQSIDEIKEANKDANITYSAEAISQLFSLQIFDTICGQYDRHFANFHFKAQKTGNNVVMGEVRGLDNDIAFGTLNFKDVKNGYGKMKPLIVENLKAIPIQMLNTIMSMEKDTLKLSVCDILNDSEIDAMWDRLEGIKNEIKAKQKDMGLKERNGRYFYEGDDANDTLRQLDQLKKLSKDGGDMAVPTLFDSELLKNTNVTKMRDDLKNNMDSALKAEASAERQKIRENRLDGVEKNAMDKLKALLPKNLPPAAATELSQLDSLFEEFMQEAKLQMAEREKIDGCDMKAMNGKMLEYSVRIKEYAKQTKKISDLFEKLSSQQSSFIKKYAGNAAYSKWKKELDEAREKSRKGELEQTDRGYSTLEKIIRAYENEEAFSQAESFTREEVDAIKQYCQNNNIPFHMEQINRVAHTFIRPVRRDFTGAPLTEQDRYNADFNKRYKEAVVKHDSEAMKELSREFTKNVVMKIDPLNPDDISIENMEKEYCHNGIYYRRIELNMTSCVNNEFNTMFPELKAGLDELQKTDKKTYEKIEKILDLKTPALFINMVRMAGYECEAHKYSTKEAIKGLQMMIPGMIDVYKEDYSKL